MTDTVNAAIQRIRHHMTIFPKSDSSIVRNSDLMILINAAENSQPSDLWKQLLQDVKEQVREHLEASEKGNTA